MVSAAAPTPQEFWNAAYSAYSLTPIGTGWQLIDSRTFDLDGFHAVAFENQSTANVIIAYEGSILDPSDPQFYSVYGVASWFADKDLAFGRAPAALQDAIAFANSPVVGGVTFGATGLPGFSGISPNPYSVNLVDYVDYGDWVGNYARDSVSELRDLAQVGSHVGTVMLVGTRGEAANLEAADRQGWLSVPGASPIIFW